MQVPTGGQLPTADGRVQMYPCFAFEFHLMLVAIDPDLGKPEIKRYVIGHDCGTVINPEDRARHDAWAASRTASARRSTRSSPTTTRAS